MPLSILRCDSHDYFVECGIRSLRRSSVLVAYLLLCNATNFGSLPDLATFFRWPDHRIANFTFECLGELRHVGQWPIRSKSSEWMRILTSKKACKLWSCVIGPVMSICEKESLLGRKAIDILRPRLT